MAQDRIGDGVSLAVGMVVFALVGAYTLPIAIEQWYVANLTGASDNVVTLWELTPLFIVLGVVLFVIGWALKSAGFMD